jgi:transcriptional regulator with XRE-family HTH domain
MICRLSGKMWGIMSWETLAKVVRERRKDLGLTQPQVAEVGGLSISLVRMIENNRSEGMRAAKKQGLERALRWKPGSVDAVLDGGSPTLQDSATEVVAEQSGSTAGGEGDRFALAHHVLALRDTFAAHQSTIGEDARDALAAEMARSARDAEESIIRLMPWLDDAERGTAIDLLVELRKTMPGHAAR